jgi:hypothetical protein
MASRQPGSEVIQLRGWRGAFLAQAIREEDAERHASGRYRVERLGRDLPLQAVNDNGERVRHAEELNFFIGELGSPVDLGIFNQIRDLGVGTLLKRPIMKLMFQRHGHFVHSDGTSLAKVILQKSERSFSLMWIAEDSELNQRSFKEIKGAEPSLPATDAVAGGHMYGALRTRLEGHSVGLSRDVAELPVNLVTLTTNLDDGRRIDAGV